MDDSALFEAWRAGDRKAGAELVERHYDSVARFFSTKAGEHADDLVQRTFLGCTEAAARFRGESGFRTFLFAIARNVLFEHIRHQTKGRARELDFETASIADLQPGIATQAARRAERRLLVRAMQHLPLELQIVLELHYWEELRVEELAAMLEIPPGTVKSRLHRGRGLLAEAMERLATTPEERQSAVTLMQELPALPE